LWKDKNLKKILANRLKPGHVLFLFGAFVGLSVAACAPQVDLQAVQKYAQTTADASVSFSQVAAGYGQSCARLKELSLTPRQWTQTTIQPVTPFLFGPTPEPAPQSTTTPAIAAMNVCDTGLAEAVSSDWDKHNKVVLGYVQALGAVAGVDVQPSFGPLGTALSQSSLINSTQATAFTDLATRITEAFVAGEQRQEIGQLVTSVNEPLKTSIAALKQVDGNYTGILTTEFIQTNTYYTELILSECGNARHPPRKVVDCAKAPTSPMLRDEIHRQRARLITQLNAINGYLQAANDYSKVLTDMEKTHQHLYDASQRKLNMQDYVSVLRQDVLPLYQDVEELKEEK
jgi:hypothetical protein